VLVQAIATHLAQSATLMGFAVKRLEQTKDSKEICAIMREKIIQNRVLSQKIEELLE
jgi:hypothetical protein